MTRTICVVLFPVVFAFSLFGQEAVLHEADSLAATKNMENLTRAMGLYDRVCAAEPQNYDARWKFASVSRNCATRLMHRGEKGWEKRSEVISKKGMQYAERAIALNPKGVEGYFYYASCVASYADAVSILRALKEGLKNKTQTNLEKAYELDKTFQDGGPAFAVGRFWAVVPWPFQDRKKALAYYQEYLKIKKLDLYFEERYVSVSELLVDMGKEHYAQARELLDTVINAGKDAYNKKKAQELLKKIGN